MDNMTISPSATAVDLPSQVLPPTSLSLSRTLTSPDPSPTTSSPPRPLVPSTHSSSHTVCEPHADADSDKSKERPPNDDDGAEKALSDKELEQRVPGGLVEAAFSPESDGPGYEYPEGGRGWLVVLGCFIIAAVTLGWGLAWGVFQSYYRATVFPDVDDSVLSVLGSLPGTVMTPVAFVSGKLADRYGYRPFIIAGCVFNFVGLLLAAFCTELWQYFLTQGVLQGVAVGLILPVAMSYPSMWFKKRRGLATGIVIAGSSFGGGAASLIVQQLLEHIGLRYTLLTYAFLHLVLMTSSVFMLKSRLHPGESDKPKTGKIRWLDASLFKQPVFWSLACAVFFTVFGYLPPYFYVQQYAQSQVPNLSPALAPVPAAVMNFSAALGRTTIGSIADRIGVLNAYFLAVMMAGLMQLLLWNNAHSFGVIMVFSIVVGFFGGAFLSLSSVIGAKLFGVRNLATLSGIILLFNTPGNAAGAPLVGAIFSASGGKWLAPITFSGMCNVVGALCILYARFKRQPRIFAAY